MWVWFIALAIVGAAAAMAVLRLRLLRSVKDKVDRGEARWEDDWDPFR